MAKYTDNRFSISLYWVDCAALPLCWARYPAALQALGFITKLYRAESEIQV